MARLGEGLGRGGAEGARGGGGKLVLGKGLEISREISRGSLGCSVC